MAQVKRFVIEIPDEFAPAFKSAVEEQSNSIGTRLESQHKYDKQDALTFAAAAFGILRAAVSEQVPEGSKYYG